MMLTFVEAALRSLLVAAAVGAGLRAFRVHNVVAQKAAWGLVLASAFIMPLLVPAAARWQLVPSGATLALPAHPVRQLRALWTERAAPSVPQPQTAPASLAAPQAIAPESGNEPAALISTVQFDAHADAAPKPSPAPRRLTLAQIAALIYMAVAGILLARLLVGLVSAVELWLAAEPIHPAGLPAFARGLKLRASRNLASPVTLGTAIVLPQNFATWQSEKLRIVLAHERSHIRQQDFYLQLAAGLYAALFWFSPLGWWLKSKLSDLAEAISDRAGLDQAPSRSAYAQLLLEFAAAPRPTPIGVAMARPHRLTRRIENLLHESRFRQAFDGGRRSLVAIALVPLALVFATSFVRVQAAGQSPQAPEPPTVPAAAPSPAAPTTPPEPAAAPAPEPPPDVPAPDDENVINVGKGQTMTIVGPSGSTSVQHSPGSHGFSLAYGKGYTHGWTSNGEPYAIVSGGRLTGTGTFDSHTFADIDKARKLSHGTFLWFSINGKSYFVDDPVIVANLQATYAPMESLGREQEVLGKQQEVLGRQQEELGRRQEQVTISMPDLSKQKAAIDAAMTRLQAKAGQTVTHEELAEIQEQLAELQGKLGALHGEMGARQGEIGAQQGALGERQGKLGAEQGRLGAQQGKLAKEADQKVQAVIHKSMESGKAHPVD